MTKSELVKAAAEKTSVPSADTLKIVDAVLEVLTESLQKGEEIILREFGTFKVVKRAARKARNIKTGEEMCLPETNVVKFRPSKTLI